VFARALIGFDCALDVYRIEYAASCISDRCVLGNGRDSHFFDQSDALITDWLSGTGSDLHRMTLAILSQQPALHVELEYFMPLIQWEQGNEENAVALLEADPKVIWFGSQPITKYFQVEGKLNRYTADFYVKFRPRYQLMDDVLEIKPHHITILNDFIEYKERMTELCRRKDANYRVWTEVDILQEPRYSNVRDISNSRHIEVPQNIARAILNFVGIYGTISILAIHNFLGYSLHETFGWIRSLLAKSLILVDIEKSIDINAKVYL